MESLKLASLIILFVMLGIGSANTANAIVITSGSYAVAANVVTSFNVAGGNSSFGPSALVSTNTATLSGVATLKTNSTVVVGTHADALQACVPFICFAAENMFVPFSSSAPYARADADFLLALVGAFGADVAEVNLPGAGTAAAEAGNTLFALVTIGAGGGTLGFSFNAAPYMDVAGTSTATMTFSIKLADAGNNTVFSWFPDGVSGNAIGGTDVDPVSLNQSWFGAAPFNPGTMSFSATTGLLPAGQYRLTVDMPETVSAVPEPTSLALFSLGLAGLVLIRHKRAQVFLACPASAGSLFAVV